MTEGQKLLADALFNADSIRFGEFTLKGGSVSPVYVDLRVLPSHPSALGVVAVALGKVLQDLEFDCIVGLPYAGIPLAVAVVMSEHIPAIVLRKERHASGTQKLIDGDYEAGQTVVILDDVITTGGTKIEMAAPLLEAGLEIRDIVVLVDREQGGRQDLEAAGYQLHSVFTLHELIGYYGETSQIDAETCNAVLEYLAA